jgi:DNA (cytosine-5)-methyltransferase 1
MTSPLVLSIFPGAFEAEGFCVVRGPDVLLGGDIRKFHAPRGRFDGVIGGPPCQSFSVAIASRASDEDETGRAAAKFQNLIPEFERVVKEADRAIIHEFYEGHMRAE